MLRIRMTDWKLKHKVIFHVMVIGLISGSGLTFLLLDSLRRTVKFFNAREMAHLVAIFNRHSVQASSTASYPSLDTTLSEMSEAGTVDRIRILDEKGRILYSTAGDRIGSSLAPIELRRLKESLAQERRRGRSGAGMVTMDQSYLPLANSSSCRRCHTDGSEYLGILDVTFDTAAEATTLRSTRWLAVGVALLTLALMIFVTFRLYSRVIDRPLRFLMNTMRRVEGGDLTPRMKLTRKDEFGTLSQSFDSMVSHLDEATREAARHHDLEMEKAGHLASLGEIAAGLAHEIRNPVAGITGAVEVIIQQSPPEDPRREILEEVLRQADRVQAAIQNLLHFARPRELKRERQNPNVCVQTAVQMAEHLTQGKDIRFRFFPLKDPGLAELDGDKIQEVILNLLLNSIAAIKNEGEITVFLKENEGQLEIRVEDNGPGIAPEHLALIFNPFFTTRKKGTGLGLALCRQIVQMHDGTITAESEPGRRTVFTIRLPLERTNRNT